MQLRFDPVHMLFFVNQNVFQEFTAGVVVGFKAGLDPVF